MIEWFSRRGRASAAFWRTDSGQRHHGESVRGSDNAGAGGWTGAVSQTVSAANRFSASTRRRKTTLQSTRRRDCPESAIPTW